MTDIKSEQDLDVSAQPEMADETELVAEHTDVPSEATVAADGEPVGQELADAVGEAHEAELTSLDSAQPAEEPAEGDDAETAVLSDESLGIDELVQRTDGEAQEPAAPAVFEQDENGLPMAHEAASDVSFAEAAQELTPDAPPAELTEEEKSELREALRALVFVADKPAKLHDLARATEKPVEQVRMLLDELRDRSADDGVRLQEVAEGWVLRTHPRFASYVMDLTGQKPVKLSRAQVETLAILAYRQPITRPEIDEIRGVDSGAVLKVLLERDLIRILGKRDEPGRPILYGTTKHFLEFFGLRSLRDMPTLREFTELSDDSRRVAESKLGENFDAPPPVSEAAEPVSTSVAADDREVEETFDDEDGLDPSAVAEESHDEEQGDTTDADELHGDDDDDDGEVEAGDARRHEAKVIDLTDWQPPPVEDGIDDDEPEA